MILDRWGKPAPTVRIAIGFRQQHVSANTPFDGVDGLPRDSVEYGEKWRITEDGHSGQCEPFAKD